MKAIDLLKRTVVAVGALAYIVAVGGTLVFATLVAVGVAEMGPPPWWIVAAMLVVVWTAVFWLSFQAFEWILGRFK